MDSRELRLNLEFELESLRNSYRFFKKTPPRLGNRMERKKCLNEITALATELKEQMAEVPEYPLLCELRLKDENEALRLLKLLVANVVLYHTTSEVMSPDMIDEVALRLLYQFGGLTLEDVALCFHQVKNGTRGKVYNRVDAAVIMIWLHDYQKDMQEIGMERNQRIANNDKTGVWKDSHPWRLVDLNRQKDFDHHAYMAERANDINARETKRIKELMNG